MNKPISVLVIGMAGSGKTTLQQSVSKHFEKQYIGQEESIPQYCVNQDPAIENSEGQPYFADIDIRDTVNYKKVMKEYSMGPNGAIVTSQNLFATKYHQVQDFCEEKSKQTTIKYIFFDTPGQIEVFTWSASGTIITETTACTFPTVVQYVVDIVRNLNSSTFMSNMLHACAIMFKTKLPFILVFNKIDIVSPAPIISWMKDIGTFLDSRRENITADSSTFMDSLVYSTALLLEQFYKNCAYVCVSSETGEGIEELLDTIEKSREEYNTIYLPIIENRKKTRENFEMERQKDQMEQLHMDKDKDKDKDKQSNEGKFKE